MTSEQINEKIGEIADNSENYSAGGFTIETGKVIPYIGWFWRTVDFDSRISLGDCGGRYIGFMENNKWGYAEGEVTEEQDIEIKRQLVSICEEPTNEKLLDFFQYLQTCRGNDWVGWDPYDY